MTGTASASAGSHRGGHHVPALPVQRPAGQLAAACRSWAGVNRDQADHRLKQQPGWKVDQLPDGTFRWTTPALVAIRDSKSPDGPDLLVSPAAWQAFLQTIRA
jgi:hypothetical protein